MNIRIIRPGVAVLTAMAVAGPAAADLTFFEVAKWQTYTQNSNAQPTVTNSYGFTARVFSNSAGEVMNGTVETPLTTVYNTAPNGAFVSGYSNFSFANEAAMDALFPTGDYTFTLTDGPRAGDSDTVTFNDPGWADTVPYLTGTTYSDLQGADVNSAISFNWTTYDTPGTYTTRQTYFYLYDITAGGGTVFAQQGNADTFTSKTFAAGSLIAGHTYQFQLLFGALDQSESAVGLAPARPTTAMYVNTTGRFTTAVPEPATMAALGLGLAAVLRRKRK